MVGLWIGDVAGLPREPRRSTGEDEVDDTRDGEDVADDGWDSVAVCVHM